MAVKMTAISQIDTKGRLMIPKSIRKAIGLAEGMYVLLMADIGNRQLAVSPFADPTAKLVRFRIRIPDFPGSLARMARVLADINVDLLATESRTLQRGQLAEWFVIADVSSCSCTLDEARERILREGARDVEVRSY